MQIIYKSIARSMFSELWLHFSLAPRFPWYFWSRVLLDHPSKVVRKQFSRKKKKGNLGFGGSRSSNYEQIMEKSANEPKSPEFYFSFHTFKGLTQSSLCFSEVFGLCVAFGNKKIFSCQPLNETVLVKKKRHNNTIFLIWTRLPLPLDPRSSQSLLRARPAQKLTKRFRVSLVVKFAWLPRFSHTQDFDIIFL